MKGTFEMVWSQVVRPKTLVTGLSDASAVVEQRGAFLEVAAAAEDLHVVGRARAAPGPRDHVVKVELASSSAVSAAAAVALPHEDARVHVDRRGVERISGVDASA